MQAIGYFRESPSRRQSLGQQNKAFLEFCEREGYDVAGTFVDTAGSNGQAPGFRQLVTFLRGQEHGFVVVVVADIESLGHELRDASRRYFQLEGLGARVTSIGGSADVAADLVSARSARQEGVQPGDRVRAAMRRKAVEGEVLGRPPFGYRVGNRRRLELRPEEAVVVRYIFRLYLQELIGIRLIARRLNQEGLKTRRGGNWSMVSIRDILRNRAYLGTYARFGVKVPGSHAPLVSIEDFRLVQDRMSARRTSHAPRVASQFLLSGITYCGYCANKLIGVSRTQSWIRKGGERVTNSYRYYQCESRTNQSLCGYHTRRAASLEEQVRESLVELIAAGHGFPQAGDQAAVIAERTAQRDRLRARIRAIDRRLDGLVEAAATGRLTKEKMQRPSIAAAADRLAAEDALEAAERRLQEYADDLHRKGSRERELSRLVETLHEMAFPDRLEGLREAVSRISVADDAVKVTLRP